jgi:ABC-type dipeptide/oligopeptide/nickel transport system permease component
LLIPALQVLFASKLHWLPVGGWHGLFSKNVILPTIALTIGDWAGIARLVRIQMLQVLEEEFVRTARSKGLRERVVLTRHVFRNAMLPVVTSIIASIFFLFGGSFFVETLFGIPGVARESVMSVNSRDYDEFMALTIIGALAFIALNIFLDIIYTFIDPRIRLSTS